MGNFDERQWGISASAVSQTSHRFASGQQALDVIGGDLLGDVALQ